MDVIEFVALDMVGVIVLEKKIVSQKLFGSLVDPGVSRDELKRRFDDGLRLGNLDREGFWSGVGSGDWHSLERDFLDSLKINPEASPLVSSLVARGLAVGVVSDLPRGWATALLERAGLDRDITVRLFTDVEGVEKEGGALMALLPERCDVAAGRILYLDDRLEHAESAARLGMRSVWLAPEGEEPTPGADVEVVHRLADLESFV